MFDTIFDDLYNIGREINNIFETRQPIYKVLKWPEINIYNNSDEYVAVVKIPGVDKKDISITLKDNSLKISGERKKEDKKDNCHMDERFNGNFERNILFNEKVDPEKIDAQLNNGLLIIKLQKSPLAKPKNISIK